MTTNHKPEYRITPKGRVIARDCGQNAEEYIRRANAYQRWVEFAKFVASQDPNGLTTEGNRARALLRELGEKP